MELRSIAETRELLGTIADGLADEEIAAIRDATYAVARVLVAAAVSAAREERALRDAELTETKG